MTLSREEVTQEMREAAADFIGIEPEELDLNKKLRLEYGISSIDAAEMIVLMEEKYKIKIPVVEAQKILSTQDAIDYIMNNAK
jgi:NADH dehydrogenase (ubiquinone) 1 alpha/beta subcomplex 1